MAGTRHTFSRIFDTHANDRDLWEAEVKPLIAPLVSGENVAIVTAGHMRSGRESVFSALATFTAEALIAAMSDRQRRSAAAAESGASSSSDGGGGLVFTLTARYVAVVPGETTMADLVAAGSTEVRCAAPLPTHRPTTRAMGRRA